MLKTLAGFLPALSIDPDEAEPRKEGRKERNNGKKQIKKGEPLVDLTKRRNQGRSVTVTWILRR